MPTNKEMEFARLLISKEMLSRAEMQRHLDEVDYLRKSGKKTNLEQYLVDNGIVTAQELRFLKAPKKRVVHCSKCKTMYRVDEEDVGKRFKCKQCGTVVIVPRPGQTSTKAVKEIRPEVKRVGTEVASIDTQKVLQTVPKKKVQPVRAAIKKPQEPAPPKTAGISPEEMTIMLGLEDEQVVQKTGDSALQATKPLEIKSAVPQPGHPAEPEATIMLDLDEEEDGEDVELIEDELDEDDFGQPQLFFPSEMQRLNLEKHSPESALAASDTEQPTPRPIPAVSMPPDESPEVTIMLDLDEDDDEAIEVIDDEDFDDSPLPSRQPVVSPIFSTPDTEKLQPRQKEPKPTIESPELTVMLDLDDDDDSEDSPPELIAIEQLLVKPVVENPAMPIRKPDAPKPLVSAKPVSPAKPEPPEPPASAKPVLPAKPKPLESPAPTKPVLPPEPASSFDPPELTIMLDLDEDEDEDEDVISAVEQERTSDNLEEWALSGYGGEGAEQINIETKIPESPEKKDTATSAKPIPYLNRGEENALDVWAKSGKKQEAVETENIEIVRTLARGKSGVIYEALVDGKRVGMKVLSQTVAIPEVMEQLRDDIALAVQLRHSNIVEIYHMGLHNQHHYYTMQYIERAEELRKMWPRIRFSQDMLVQMILQLLDALTYAHNRNFIHEYIDWENILLQGESLLLRDFGMFAIHDMAQRNLFSPMFMSPEKVKDVQVPDVQDQVDHRTDIYSLGAVMYWMVTGLLPFAGDDLATMVLQIYSKKPVPPCEIDDEISPGISYIIMKAMEKFPDDRYQSAQEMAADLSEMINT